ncbi:MAG TPA: hypothetical protein VNX87_28520 [Candidatus Sulfotelmatobacter sp.]|jgi:hypothetical protein|nr:hypothetical protein [Candidatus Sulfotelmatobacter sp.]
MKTIVDVVAKIKFLAVELTGLIGFLSVLGFIFYTEYRHFLAWLTQPVATK